MPEGKTRQRAKKAKLEDKAPTTQAGEYVREEMHHRNAKRPVKSRKQAVAIGLSKARRDGSRCRASGVQNHKVLMAPGREAGLD